MNSIQKLQKKKSVSNGNEIKKCMQQKKDARIITHPQSIHLVEKYHNDIDGYLGAHKLVMRFMLSFHQLEAVLMLLRGNLCGLLLYYFNIVAIGGLPL